ncbi:hypothetical protein [Micromonospora nigra]|uniref:hypothetical protein n=1 Tax=Micromonospora nigra TaxID=145857 RepID=UPI0015865AE8|nr:hypothetical protein [Micromonospora nigra]
MDEAALPGTARDRLTGPFAHIVLREAQELTDARRRKPSPSSGPYFRTPTCRPPSAAAISPSYTDAFLI